MYYIDYALEKVNQEIASAKHPSFSLGIAAENLKRAQQQVAILERLWGACDALGICIPLDGDPDTAIPWMEKLVSGDYRHSKEDLSESIVRAIQGVREAEYEAEGDEAVDAVTAAGFEYDEENDNWHRGAEIVTIESFHKSQYDWWYTFEYNHPDGTRVSGKSGEFAKLLEAIKGSGKEK